VKLNKARAVTFKGKVIKVCIKRGIKLIKRRP
jgi:hypothetical protein